VKRLKFITKTNISMWFEKSELD